jgi:hypothetical protein
VPTFMDLLNGGRTYLSHLAVAGTHADVQLLEKYRDNLRNALNTLWIADRHTGC